MQYLNGAALANVWVFYEHLDKLEYTEFEAFNKEIQMVQQQFIISELCNESTVMSDPEPSSKSRLEETEDDPGMSIEGEGEHDDESQDPSPDKDEDELPPSNFRPNKICFGVFGSFGHKFIIKEPELADKYCSTAESGFRTLDLVKPDNSFLIETVLRCEGFRNQDKLKNIFKGYLAIFEKKCKFNLTLLNQDICTICRIAGVIATQETNAFLATLTNTEETKGNLPIIHYSLTILYRSVNGQNLQPGSKC
jgi:hypothetical protein